MRFKKSAGKMRVLAMAALIICCCQASALPLLGSLALQGSAVYSQLQHDYYHAELYVNPGESGDSTNNAQVMKITILAVDWSRRNFNQYWSQAVSINNNAAVLESLASELEAFRSVIKGSLKEGDQLVISQHAGKGTKISLNSVELLNTPSSELFQSLLRSWVGQRPPSSQFKSAITGDLPAQALPQSSTLAGAPSEARKKEILNWKAVDKSASNSTANAQSPEKGVSGQVPRLPQAGSIPAAVAKSTAQTASEAITKTAANESIAEKQVKTQNVAIVLAEPAAPNAAAKDEQQAATIATKVEPAATPAPMVAINAPDNTEPGKKIELTSSEKFPQSGLFKVYRSNLLKLTYQNLIYPTGAINRNQQGKVVLQLTLNRQGKVKQVELESPSEFSLLNKAATKAVKKAGPFPSVPRALQGKEIVVSLPINFVLGD